MRVTTKHLLLAALALGGVFALVGCGDDDDDDDDDDVVGAVTVNISLTEYEIAADPATAPAGPIKFAVTNDGEMEHEFLVIDTDLAEDALPTNADGSYDEGGAGTEVADELEDMDPGDSANLNVTLAAGAYVLICNEVMEGTAHYAEGMHTPFTVE